MWNIIFQVVLGNLRVTRPVGAKLLTHDWPGEENQLVFSNIIKIRNKKQFFSGKVTDRSQTAENGEVAVLEI